MQSSGGALSLQATNKELGPGDLSVAEVSVIGVNKGYMREASLAQKLKDLCLGIVINMTGLTNAENSIPQPDPNAAGSVRIKNEELASGLKDSMDFGKCAKGIRVMVKRSGADGYVKEFIGIRNRLGVCYLELDIRKPFSRFFRPCDHFRRKIDAASHPSRKPVASLNDCPTRPTSNIKKVVFRFKLYGFQDLCLAPGQPGFQTPSIVGFCPPVKPSDA